MDIQKRNLKIINLRRTKSVAFIAEKFGMTKQNVYYILNGRPAHSAKTVKKITSKAHKNVCPTCGLHKRKFDPKRPAKIVALRAKGFTWEAIANKLDYASAISVMGVHRKYLEKLERNKAKKPTKKTSSVEYFRPSMIGNGKAA